MDEPPSVVRSSLLPAEECVCVGGGGGEGA